MIKNVVLGNFNEGTDAANNLYWWAQDIRATNTDWVRIWIDWRVLAPFAPGPDGPVNPATDTRTGPISTWSPAFYVYYLDFQVRAARQAGFKVIITYWLYPGWTYGDSGIGGYELADDFSLTSPWAQYLLWIMTRYSVYNPDNEGGYADVVEICNETDFAPSATGDRSDTAQKTAQMMVTAQQLRVNNGLQAPILAGPGHTDDPATDAWIDQLIADMTALGFHGDTSFIWTMHNYVDVAFSSVARGQTVRAKLAPFWTGWPLGQLGSPVVLATEGGSLAADRRAQRDQVVASYGLWSAEPGLAMFSQYLNVSSVTFDSGMRDYPVNQPRDPHLDRNAPRRPLWSAWSGLA